MCFDICTINIRVSIRVRGLHLVLCGQPNAKQLPVPPINMVVLGTRPSPAAQHRVFDAHRPAFLNMLMGDSLTDKDSSYSLSMCMYIYI